MEWCTKAPKTWVRIVAKIESSKPFSNKKYELKVGSKTYQGVTGEDGLLEAEVPPDAEEGELTIWKEKDNPASRITWQLKIGCLDPVADALSRHSCAHKLSRGKNVRRPGAPSQSALSRHHRRMLLPVEFGGAERPYYMGVPSILKLALRVTFDGRPGRASHEQNYSTMRIPTRSRTPKAISTWIVWNGTLRRPKMPSRGEHFRSGSIGSGMGVFTWSRQRQTARSTRRRPAPS